MNCILPFIDYFRWKLRKPAIPATEKSPWMQIPPFLPFNPPSQPQPLLSSCPAKPCGSSLPRTRSSALWSKTLIPQPGVLECRHRVQQAYSRGRQLKIKSFTSRKCMILLAFNLAFPSLPLQKWIWVAFVLGSVNLPLQWMRSYGAVDVSLS